MKRNLKVCLLAVFMVAILLFAVTGCSKSGGKEVDCQELIDVQITGFEGYGKVTFAFQSNIASDRDKMDSMFPDNTRKEAEGILKDLYELLTIEADKTEDIKNGDKITVTVDEENAEELLKKYGLKLSNTKFSVEADGLDEGEILDAFAGVNVTFEGFDTAGRCNISVRDVDEVLQDYGYYEWDNSANGGLKNGDKIVLKYVEYIEGYLLDKGYAVEETEKTYTVSGLEALQEIDPFDYLTVSFEGYDGDGKASVKRASGFLDVLYYYTITVSEDEDLSNGDKITVRFEGDYDASVARDGYILSVKEKEYTVADLQSYEIIDVLADELFEITGVSPMIEIKVKTSDLPSGVRYNITYHIEGGTLHGDKMRFKEGDQVTITVEPEIDSLHYYGYELASLEKTITLEGYSQFADAGSDISAYQDARDKAAAERIELKFLNDYNYSWSNKLLTFSGLKVVEEGLYVLVDNELENYGNWSKRYYNYYYTLYEVKGTWDRDREDVKYYYMVCAYDLTYDADGNLTWTDVDAKLDDQIDYIEVRDQIELDYYRKVETGSAQPEKPMETKPAETETDVEETKVDETKGNTEETTKAASEKKE